MNVLNKFVFRNLKLNKKRTIVTIIGIMLSVSLIVCLASLVVSMVNTFITITSEAEGYQHTTFQKVDSDSVKYVTDNVNTNEYFLTTNLGYASFGESLNEYKPYFSVYAYDELALQKYGVSLSQGSLPTNSNEIVISSHIISNAKANYEIGDTITLNMGQRVVFDEEGTEYLLDQNNPYLEDEIFKETDSKTYTIVGIMDRPSYSKEGYDSPGYTVITYLDENITYEMADVSVIYSDIYNTFEINEEIFDVLQENNKDYDIAYVNTNDELLNYNGVGSSDSTLTVVYTMGAIVAGIIILTSVFVIKNSFSISISEKVTEFGLFSSVGATKKQIISAVVSEGVILGLIAIPLGIILGMVASYVLIILMNTLLEANLNGFVFTFCISKEAIIISVILSMLTIYLSTFIPAIMASRISAIEALRLNNDIKINAKKMKTNKLIKKIFGIGGVIAYKNIKRNKKKYRTTVISLVVSITVFIAMSSFIEYGFNSLNVVYNEIGYNVCVLEDSKQASYFEELYNTIADKENINSYMYIGNISNSIFIDMDKYGTDLANEYLSHYDFKIYNLEIVRVNDEYFEKMLDEVGKTDLDTYLIYNKLDTSNVINEDGDSLYYYGDYLNIKSGDELEFSIKEYVGDEAIFINYTKEVTLIENQPMDDTSGLSESSILYVSESNEEFKEYEVYYYNIFFDAKDPQILSDDLELIKKEIQNYDNIYIANVEEQRVQVNNMLLMVSIFLYGFIAVITLIGVTNIFNTITTNMMLRSKEFANLKSIGMTNKEFKNMIRLESIMLGTSSLVIGIVLGLIASYFMGDVLNMKISQVTIVPYKAIALSIVAVFGLVYAIMRYSLKQINKQNIIETIRKDTT